MTEQTSAFQSAIDAVRALSLEDQEALLTLHEFVQGNVTFGSVDDLMAGLED
jgi:hypothetical protein